MNAMSMGVKFCGAMTAEDIWKAAAAGGRAVGVIVRPDSTYAERSEGSHSIDVDTACRLGRLTPHSMKFFVLPHTSEYDEIVEIGDAIGPDVLQLGEVDDPEVVKALKDRYKAGPCPDLAQVVHVDENTSIEDVDPFLDHVRYFLFDSAGALPGGNGTVHDWEKSQALAGHVREQGRVRKQGKFVILAGGLNPDNAADAAETVAPDMLDVETGVRDPLTGTYDPELMRAFVENAMEGTIV